MTKYFIKPAFNSITYLTFNQGSLNVSDYVAIRNTVSVCIDEKIYTFWNPFARYYLCYKHIFILSWPRLDRNQMIQLVSIFLLKIWIIRIWQPISCKSCIYMAPFYLNVDRGVAAMRGAKHIHAYSYTDNLPLGSGLRCLAHGHFDTTFERGNPSISVLRDS